MSPFTYLEPTSIEEVLEILNRYGDEAKLIGGGTALVNFMKNQLVQPRFIVGLRRLTNLASVSCAPEIRIGALTTLHTLETSPIIAAYVPLLATACHHVATIRIRMMATLGGAMAYADPSLDTPPALIASDARIRIRGPEGTREAPLGAFFTGIYETLLRADELITEIVVPPQPRGCGTAFLKFLPATHEDYPTVSVATRLSMRDGIIQDVRIALGAVGFTPIRAERSERQLIGMTANEQNFRDGAALVAGEIEPLADFRGSSEYKRDMAVVHVRRALAIAAARADSVAATK